MDVKKVMATYAQYAINVLIFNLTHLRIFPFVFTISYLFVCHFPFDLNEWKQF